MKSQEKKLLINKIYFSVLQQNDKKNWNWSCNSLDNIIQKENNENPLYLTKEAMSSGEHGFYKKKRVNHTVCIIIHRYLEGRNVSYIHTVHVRVCTHWKWKYCLFMWNVLTMFILNLVVWMHKITLFFCTLNDFDLANTFQNLRVSSPAPVTIVWPSGDIA